MSNLNKYHDSILTKPKLSLSEIDDKKTDEIIEENSCLIRPEPLPVKASFTSPMSPIITSSSNNDNKLKYTLHILDLEKLFDDFHMNMITFNDLFLLSKEDLVEMKIPIGPRNRILHFATLYKQYAKTYEEDELINFFNEHRALVINNDVNKLLPSSSSSRICKSSSNIDAFSSVDSPRNNITLKPTCSVTKMNNTVTNNTNTTSNNTNNTSPNNSASSIMKNFQSLFSEVENFQMKYENMKIKNDLRNDKINSLLNNGRNSSKRIDFDKGDLMNETERNLNDELSNIYEKKKKNMSCYSSKHNNSNYVGVNMKGNHLLNAIYKSN